MRRTVELTILPLLVALPLGVRATGAAAGETSRNELDVQVGIGYDSNAFLTPNDPYYDQIAALDVTPDKKSGFFVPVGAKGEFMTRGDRRRFGILYRVRGNFYTGGETTNADEYYLRVEPGVEFVLGRQGRKENTLWIAPTASYKKEIFFDRDTGVDSTAGGSDVSDRYTYTGLGAELKFEVRTTRVATYSLEASYEDRNYEEVPAISSLDHVKADVGGEVTFNLGESVKLSLDYTYRLRDYDERPARLLDGTALTSNPRLEYTYHLVGASLRTRPVKPWILYLDYDHWIRDDGFVGYNDYSRNAFRLRSIVKTDRTRFRVALRYWDRSYDNAFIFDNPTNPLDATANPHKSYESLDLEASFDVTLRDRLELFLEFDARDQDTADPRYAYGREQIVVGIRWEK